MALKERGYLGLESWRVFLGVFFGEAETDELAVELSGEVVEISMSGFL
jgi:hypothetical protein